MTRHFSGFLSSPGDRLRLRLTTISILTLVSIVSCAAAADTLTLSGDGGGIWTGAVGGGWYGFEESAADTFSDPLYRQFILMLSAEYRVKGWHVSFPFDAHYWMWRDGPKHKTTLLLSANVRAYGTLSRFTMYGQVGIGTGAGLPLVPVAFPYALGFDYRLSEKTELGIQIRRMAYTEPGEGTYFLLVLRISP